MLDSHAHVLCRDTAAFPPHDPTPDKLDYLRDHAFDAGDLRAAMDEAGVDRALVVQRGQFYGPDNSYVCAAAAAHPDRLRAICGIDSRLPDCADAAAHWMERGGAGLRVMGHPRETDLDWLGGDNAQALWRFCADRGVVLCGHLFPAMRDAGIDLIESLLDRFPLPCLVLDHLANTPIASADDPGIDDRMRRLADRANVVLKVTAIPLAALEERRIDTARVLGAFAGTFGADRLMWGSDVTQSKGSYAELVALAQRSVAGLPEADRQAVLGGTAARVYGWD